MSAADLLMKSYFAAWVIETPRTPGYVAGNVNTMRLAELYDDFRAAEARIRELEAEIARADYATRRAVERKTELESRISEGERLFKKMLMMSGSELGGPHPIWADVERYLNKGWHRLGDPPSSQFDRGSK